MSFFNSVPESLPDVLGKLDLWGGPETFPHYAIGWAVAGSAPFAYAKQVASDFGGTADGMVIRWPKGITERGGIRRQFHHVIDIAPTVLEAAGLPEPRVVNGTEQKPIEGVSLAYTFAEAQPTSRRVTQYFEIAGNRAIYHDGWLARVVHRAPWEQSPTAPLDQDTWELSDCRNDFSLAQDLSAKNPQKLAELQALFLEEAVKYDVLPIDDRSMERLDPAAAGRPDLMAGRTELTLYEGMTGMLENAFINVKNRSSSITADIDVPAGARGVIVAQAGRFGGWSLYFDEGRPAYAYNWIGRETYTVASTRPVPAGRAEVRLDFVYDGGGRGKGGVATLYVNGQQVASGRIANTNPTMFSVDEAADVGVDAGTPVTEAYTSAGSRFTGRIRSVRIEAK
jgi:arylsulfatase